MFCLILKDIPHIAMSLWFLFLQTTQRILKHTALTQSNLSRAQRHENECINADIWYKHSRIQQTVWIGTQLLRNYNLIIMKQYANQGAAFMRNPHTHIHTYYLHT